MRGLYIHVPYCIHKCSYCDFYSVESLNSKSRFVDNLVREIELRAEHYPPGKREISTIFLGGGTPSLLKPRHLEKIFNSINQHFIVDDNPEITIECNPGAIDVKYMREYPSFGINRISFGVQSFVESELKFLERIHSPGDVAKAFDTARECGFDNLSLDLIFSIPVQTTDSWRYSLKKAMELQPRHFSAYSLIYEPGTPLYEDFIREKFKAQPEDNDIDFYKITGEIASKYGFGQYEVSNYALPGFMCRHNLNYWNSGEYFAFGPSAHGHLVGKRYANYRSNHKYFSMLESGELPLEITETLSEEDRAFEKLYLQLRATGLDVYDFETKHGIKLQESAEEVIKDLLAAGLICFDGRIIKPTETGYFNGDTLTLKFAESLKKVISSPNIA